jgi:hypothetical protein
MKSSCFIFVVCAFFVLLVTVTAEIPRLINYQGMLTDHSGIPLDGSYSITFKIYNSSSDGLLRWQETQSGIAVDNGMFNVLLGSLNPIDSLDFNEDYWLEVTVDGETMPRLRFTSVGYAYRALVADSALTTTAGSGSHWSVIDSVLYTNKYWGITKGGVGNILYGDSAYTMVNLGIGCTAGQGGLSEQCVTISGGKSNRAYRTCSTVGGGSGNFAESKWSTVCGGAVNKAGGSKSSVVGGAYNVAEGFASIVGGGEKDTSKACYGGLFSGYGNLAGDEDIDTAAFVGGGYNNRVTDKYGTVAGGYKNTARGWYATVGGGYSGTADNTYATLGGGRDNSASGEASTVSGGGENSASGDYSTVAGGYDNSAGAWCSSVLGGYGNNITNTGSYSYLFGIGSQLTQDSTFMVDMPHIRFGDETDGYEFPWVDGSGGQVLATNGSGQLSWTDPSSGVGGGGTAGYLSKFTGSTTLGNSVIYETGGKIGIGTTSLSEKLEVSGGAQFSTNGGELILRTPTHNDPGRYAIRFDNNYLAPFIGDDTEDQYFNFLTTFAKARTYDAHLRVFGSASDSWGNCLELTHDGNSGKITTDAGDLLLIPEGNVGIGSTDLPSEDTKLHVRNSEIDAMGCYAIKGVADCPDGPQCGVFGWAMGTVSFGVFGQGDYRGVCGTCGAANGIGVYGESSGKHGTAVYAYAIGDSSCGVYGYGKQYDFYADGPGANYASFTGSHEVKLSPDFPRDLRPGTVVSLTGEVEKRLLEDGKVCISSTLPQVRLCNSPDDISVFGVLVAGASLGPDHWYQAKEGERFAHVNAVGEGRVWVCSANGDIQAGDYITTSSVPGYGQRQDDDLLHSYTLGKAIETVDWDLVGETLEIDGKTFKIYLVAVVYTSG